MKEKSRINGMLRVAAAGLLVNLVLSGVKLYIGLSANSISIFSDAVHNFLDALCFGIIIFGFCVMKKKPTARLPFGYGRVEYLAGFLTSVTVFLAGVWFLYSALERLFYPFLLVFSRLNFWLIAASAAVKLLTAFYFRYKNRALRSDVLRSASADGFLDSGITLMTLVGFGLYRYAALRLDAAIGIVISIVIIVEGAKLLKESARILLGGSPGAAFTERVRLAATEYGVTEIKNARLHDYGANCKELILETVFTNARTCDIMETEKAARGISERLSEEFGAEINVYIALR
ncbi:MAG: cation diffusion facilitator family transporter [Clostridiales bacterium]|jgi:cation diffusion facilitator family transporter|nr:cation diffusion facilitator family transporter [Clostridiales bacterium]